VSSIHCVFLQACKVLLVHGPAVELAFGIV
jgi:hypothetical protein